MPIYCVCCNLNDPPDRFTYWDSLLMKNKDGSYCRVPLCKNHYNFYSKEPGFYDCPTICFFNFPMIKKSFFTLSCDEDKSFIVDKNISKRHREDENDDENSPMAKIRKMNF